LVNLGSARLFAGQTKKRPTAQAVGRFGSIKMGGQTARRARNQPLGLLQGFVAKNKEEEQNKCEDNHRIKLLVVKKCVCESIGLLQKRSQVWLSFPECPFF
jgi:hypothetical protein